MCKALPGLHSFTGNTVSAFAGHGKLAAFKLLKTVTSFQDLFKLLFTDWQLSDELFGGLQAFICSLYSSRTSTFYVNELRYLLFCAK